jgi:hypothetical protein
MHEAQASHAPHGTSTGDDADDHSKDAFFAEVGDVAQRMIDKHGKDFAMGVLIIGARFIAEGKPLTRPK